MHLDYLSCVLTVISTFLVGRRNWTGLVLAAVNSLIVCDIGWKTAQMGLIPANVFCLGVYAFSVRSWRRQAASKKSAAENESVAGNEKQDVQAPVRVPSFRRILAKASAVLTKTEAKPQVAVPQNEQPHPLQVVTVTESPAWAGAQHKPRRRKVRPAVAWHRPGIYSRATAQ